MDNEPFDLTVEIRDAENIGVRTGGAGEAGPVKLALDPTRRQVVELFEEWLREGKIGKRRELKVLGTLLYEAIFTGDVGNFFKRKLADFEKSLKDERKLSPEKRLRVELVFRQKAQDLARLPWEFLFCPDTETSRGFFLSSKTNLVLSRHIPSDVNRVVLNASEIPLKILVVLAQPKAILDKIALGAKGGTDEKKTDYNPVINDIENFEKRMSSDGKQPLVKVKVLRDPTFDEFIKQLEEYKPHVLHYIGHGRYDEKEKDSLCLLEENRTEAKWLSSEAFAGVFEGGQPRLVFLQICQDPTESSRVNFADLAPALIGMNVQAVVALRYPVTVAVARKFTNRLYDMLLNRESVASAVHEARRWMNLVDIDASLGSPVLFMHSYDGPILQEPAAAVTKSTAQPAVDPRRGVTATLPTDSPSLETALSALEKTAYVEAGRNSVDSGRVEAELQSIRAEMQGKGFDDLLGLMTNRMKCEVQLNATSALVPIYSAMLKHLIGLMPPKI